MMANPARMLRRTGANLARGARRVVERVVMPRRFWLELRLGGSPDDLAEPRFPLAKERPQGFLEILQTLDAAADDPHVEGILLRLRGSLGGFSRVLTLRRAIDSNLSKSNVSVCTSCAIAPWFERPK